MDEKVLMAALAGLLHDVGKVEQRAKDDPWNPPDDVRDSGQPVHAAWSIRVAGLVPKAYQRAALAGGYHHQPEKSPAQDQYLSKLVALADKLSAGERSDLPKDYKTRKPPQQLVSIFDRISQANGDRLAEHYLPIAPLSLDGIGSYIESDKQPAANARDGYDALRLALESAVKQDIPDAETYLEHLLAEMQRLTWCVPSAFYHSVADVSLYDHSRMTAALAVCLAEKPETEVEVLLQAAREAFDGKKSLPDTPAALLVGGDISGVQDFIYTIASKGAAKTLRGRSFYLQLLTEAALRFVLYRLGLPYSNVIYSGGGNFFLLAPVSAREKLPAIRAELSRILLKHHGTALYLALGAAEVPFSGFRPGQLPQYWNAMHKAINLAKQQRYSELGDEMYAQVFEIPQQGGNPQGTCSICGDDQRKVKKLDELEAQERVCSLCSSFTEAGSKLARARFVILGWDEPCSTSRATLQDALSELGLRSIAFAENADTAIAVDARRAAIWALDDPRDGHYPQVNVPHSRVLRFVANQVPQATLDELQGDVEGGFQKLGVVRMDVDNVGNLFKEGFGEQATLSRIAALSFQLGLFFEGWIQRICARNGRQEKIYTVYTGGDDAFLLGPWDVMPALAHDIADDFAKYTARHPKITLSAGMSFIGGKYPIYQAADDAHEALEDAKNSGKDAFHFLGKSWKWAAFTELTEKHTRLEKIVGKGEESLDGPQAILQTLRQLAQDADQYSQGKSRHVWGRWIWLGMYQLTRMMERAKGKAELATQIEGVRSALHNSNYQDIDQWGAAARWTQLKVRKTNKEA